MFQSLVGVVDSEGFDADYGLGFEADDVVASALFRAETGSAACRELVPPARCAVLALVFGLTSMVTHLPSLSFSCVLR